MKCAISYVPLALSAIGKLASRDWDSLDRALDLVIRHAIAICKIPHENMQSRERRAAARVREEKQEGTPLTIRTTRCVACFNEPFSLRNVEGVLPSGDYNVYLEDELILGPSRAAYRRVSTILQLPSISSPQEQSRLVSISAADLDAAQMKDSHLTV